jgi:hypothetical protein
MLFIRYYVDEQTEKDDVGSLFGKYGGQRKNLLMFRCKFCRKYVYTNTWVFQKNAFEINFEHAHKYIYIYIYIVSWIHWIKMVFNAPDPGIV